MDKKVETAGIFYQKPSAKGAGTYVQTKKLICGF